MKIQALTAVALILLSIAGVLSKVTDPVIVLPESYNALIAPQRYNTNQTVNVVRPGWVTQWRLGDESSTCATSEYSVDRDVDVSVISSILPLFQNLSALLQSTNASEVNNTRVDAFKFIGTAGANNKIANKYQALVADVLVTVYVDSVPNACNQTLPVQLAFTNSTSSVSAVYDYVLVEAECDRGPVDAVVGSHFSLPPFCTPANTSRVPPAVPASYHTDASITLPSRRATQSGALFRNNDTDQTLINGYISGARVSLLSNAGVVSRVQDGVCTPVPQTFSEVLDLLGVSSVLNALDLLVNPGDRVLTWGGQESVDNAPVDRWDYVFEVQTPVPPETTAPPSTAAPSVAPSTSAPSAPPSSAAPSSAAPSSAAPSVAPSTAAPSVAPSTVAPSVAPTSATPSVVPSVAPSSAAPSVAPSSAAPSSAVPSVAPSSAAPSTVAPSVVPSTAEPSVAIAADSDTLLPTLVGTTAEPLTTASAAPGVTTAEPSSVAPGTTAEPLTLAPSSPAPSAAPSSASPSSAAPSTAAPSGSPTTSAPTEGPAVVTVKYQWSIFTSLAEGWNTNGLPSAVPVLAKLWSNTSHVPQATIRFVDFGPFFDEISRVVDVCSTLAPSTASPSVSPSSASPSTVAPSTAAPSVAPSSAAPSTVAPSVAPSSVAPSSAAPSVAPTVAPSSVAPSSAAPTVAPSVAPSSAAPSVAPTVAPSTAAPSTDIPTVIPSEELTTPAPSLARRVRGQSL